jgi:hypothetical protein
MGKNCGDMLKGVLCCGFEKYRREKYTWTSVGPLGCGNVDPAVIVIVVLVVVLVVAVALAGLIALVIGFIIWKKKKDHNNDSTFQNLDE